MNQQKNGWWDPQTEDKLYELLDHFALINKYENLNNTEMEEKNIVPKTV